MTMLWKIIILILLLWSAISTWHQLDQMERFAAQGPRFTAADGQALCERVQKLEPQPLPCAYAPQEPPR